MDATDMQEIILPMSSCNVGASPTGDRWCLEGGQCPNCPLYCDDVQF